MWNLSYIEPVYRPPSEARSLIIQATNGCSWNRCRFCDMYTEAQKKFRPKPLAELEKELLEVKKSTTPFRRIFLADGDVMTLSFRRLHDIMQLINRLFPDVQRVSSYCLPRNLKHKSVDELRTLNDMGLRLLYIGCESGDDEILGYVEKGETFESSLNALEKIKQAGIKSSVMILNGLGGLNFWQQHAINSAKLMNAAQPDYLSTLVVSFPLGMERFSEGFGGTFQPLDQHHLFLEMRTLLENLHLHKSIFRSDHSSNYLILKGVLNQDKDKLLQKVNAAIQQPEKANLRQEWQRGL